MPRLPPVPISPHTRLRDRFCPGVIGFGRDLVPVAAQLFGDELGEAGAGALSHLGARDADDRGVVGLDHDPGIDLGAGAALRLRRGGAERQMEAEREAAARGGGADDEACGGRAW